MKIAERLALISAGYKRKEIDAMEEAEKENPTGDDKESEKKPDAPDYKTMYEEALKANEDLTVKLTESETKIKEIQAENRKDGQKENPPHNFIDDIFNN